MTTFPITDFSDLPSAVQAINSLDRTALAANTVANLNNFYASPVAAIATCADALYADACWSLSNTSANAKTLCYQLAGLCVTNSWWELGQSGRGNGVRLEMRRQLGDPTCNATIDERPAVPSGFSLEISVSNAAPIANGASS